MFISNPLIYKTSYQNGITKITIQNPEQKYIGKICKIELLYNFKVLISGGEDLKESVGNTEFKITEFDAILEIPTTKKYEYEGTDIQLYYTLYIDIIDAVGLFNATKEDKIVLQKNLSLTTPSQNTEIIGVTDIFRNLTDKSYIGKDKYDWKIMIQKISFQKKIFLGVILLFLLLGVISIFFPKVFFGIGPFLLPFGLFGLFISFFILLFRTDYFIKAKQKTQYIVYNDTVPIQIQELIEGNSIINIESLKTKIQWNICERGKYTTGSGTNRRTVTFHKPIQSIIIYEKEYTLLPNNISIDTLLPQNITIPLVKNTLGFPIISQIFNPINIIDGSRNIFGDGLISEIEIRFEHPEFPDKIYKYIILES